MNDVFDEISRFDNDFYPEAARKPGLEVLPDGDYDFEVVAARPDRIDSSRDPVLRVDLRVLSGPSSGLTVEYLYWLNKQRDVGQLGFDLQTLGFDTASWKAPARPFSQELQKALPRLRGMRFRGKKVANPGRDGKTFHNLFINAPLKAGTPPPPPPAVAPPAQGNSARPTASIATPPPPAGIPF